MAATAATNEKVIATWESAVAAETAKIENSRKYQLRATPVENHAKAVGNVVRDNPGLHRDYLDAYGSAAQDRSIGIKRQLRGTHPRG